MLFFGSLNMESLTQLFLFTFLFPLDVSGSKNDGTTPPPLSICYQFASASTTRLIINAVGQDRLGIVADITGKVIQSGGNVGESQAAKLGSYFSLMMLVDVPTSRMDDLRMTLDTMTDMNAAVFETEEAKEKTFTPQVACKFHCGGSVLELEDFDSTCLVVVAVVVDDGHT